MVACVFAIMLAGGCSTNVTLGVTAVMVISASPGLPGGAAAIGVAVIITVPPDGIAAGAVYVAVKTPPLPVGLEMAPHAPGLAHDTAHATPESVGSFVTNAVRDAFASTVILAGALTFTEIVGVALTVAIATAVAGWLWLSVAAAVAVIVTVPPVGTLGGALKETTAPLAVLDGVRLPQLPSVLVHCRDQLTPALELSSVTVAIRFTVSPVSAAPTVNALGVTETAMAGGAAMLTTALTYTVGALMEVAVIVTAPFGGIAGAV
jgi:hypothetical protein